MTIKEAYQKMQSESGIGVGDTVKILRGAKTNEMGWNNGWVSKMDKHIGKLGIVIYIDTSGINLDVEGDRWVYPFFVLELLKKKEVKEVTMAEVEKMFGCTVKIKKEN